MDQANTSTGLTESLANFIENPGFGTLPAQAARIIKTGFTDTVATMIAGRDEPVVRIVREFVSPRQSGARDAIEHQAGYLAALSPQGRADRAGAASAPGSQLRILDTGLSIKRYPMCYATHRVIDGMLALATAHNVKPADVKAVHASVGTAQASMLRNHAPRTGLEAKFSLEFAVASALVARKVGLGELTDEFVARPQVREMMAHVHTSTTDTRCPIEPVFALTDRVALELNDGRRLDSGEIRFARGNAKLPLDGVELKAKFLDCTAGAAGLDAAALFGRLDAIEQLASVRDLAVRSPG